MTAFFLPNSDGTYRGTEHTVGPWDPTAMHAGPPGGLLARAIERCAPRDDAMVARITCEILGPVPVGEVSVTARVVRPGRTVELVEAVLRAGGREAMTARAWRIARSPGAGVPSRAPAAPPLPDEADEMPPYWRRGYLAVMECRVARGSFVAPGPAAVWSRQPIPLVDGEEPTGLQRMVTLADSGNGMSWELDMRRWWFINTELTLHVHREPVGEWLCLDAATTASPNGVGLASSTISDLSGPVGRGAQALYVGPRPTSPS